MQFSQSCENATTGALSSDNSRFFGLYQVTINVGLGITYFFVLISH